MLHRVQRLRGLIHVAALARLVREPLRFLVGQARRRPGASPYRLRSSGIPIRLRHGTPDVNTFEQIFEGAHYEMPERVRAALPPAQEPLKAVDLGANIGMFSAWLLERWPQVSVVAFEPDPDNAAVVRGAIGDGWRDQVELVEACAATAPGEVRFAAGSYSNSRIAHEGEDGVVVPAVDVFPYLADADFVKIDIEGAEWPLVADPRFGDLRAPVVALEYHPDGAPGDPHEAARAALTGAGYNVVDGEFDATPGHGMVWGWRDGGAATR